MKTTIQVSDEIRDKMRLVAALKRSTYEEILMEWLEEELANFELSGVFTESSKKKKSNKNKG